MSSVKLKLLYLAKYLMESSDEEHPVHMSDMIGYLAAMEIPAERKTIYQDLELLSAFGLDIQSRRDGRSTAYFIGSRAFQTPELKLLIDSVQTSKFITEKKSVELINKIEALASKHQARQLHHEVRVQGRIKTMNESIYYNVDDISGAITENSAIMFRYFTWNVKGERIYRRNGAFYLVSPWMLLWDDENYYLVSYEHESGLVKHFRVDKMTGISQTGEPRQGEDVIKKMNFSDYSDTHFGMFAGDTQFVTLCFENELSGVVVDRFGKDVIMVPQDDRHFNVTARVAVNVQFFGWLCGLGNQVRIVAPADVVKKMKQHIRLILKLYES